MRGRGRGGGFRGGRATNTALLRNTIVSTEQTNSTRRLQKDYKELKDAAVPLVGVSAVPSDNDFFLWFANLRGPEQSAFHGGVFHLEIRFPTNYPMSPPTITLATPIPHPNVFGSTVCLDMLQPKNKDSGWYDGWSSAYTAEAILIQLQSFLFEVPRKMREIEIKKDNPVYSVDDDESISNMGEERNKYKKAVDLANAYKSEKCRHRGSLEPYPPFHERENDTDAFVVMRDPKVMLAEEFVCYTSRNRLPDVSLGIGVSISRLPRTGEIRSVQPTLDLLSLRAFTKQKVRRSIDNSRFTHWLPLYFGERQPFETKVQKFDQATKEFVQETRQIDPYERVVKLLKSALCFLTKGSTQRELTPEMVIEIMPKLLITHMVDLASDNKHLSILALRRLINFVRLFRLSMALVPGVADILDANIKQFKENVEKRHKDFTPSLGDLLAFAIVSETYNIKDFLESYIQEQLDRQAFWMIRAIPELDHTDEKFKNKQVVLEDAREEVCFKTGLTGFQITMLFYSLSEMLDTEFGGDLKAFEQSVDDNIGCLPLHVEDKLQAKFKKLQRIENF